MTTFKTLKIKDFFEIKEGGFINTMVKIDKTTAVCLSQDDRYNNNRMVGHTYHYPPFKKVIEVK